MKKWICLLSALCLLLALGACAPKPETSQAETESTAAEMTAKIRIISSSRFICLLLCVFFIISHLRRQMQLQNGYNILQFCCKL